MDMRRIKMIEKVNRERIRDICPKITDNSGIYVFVREEDGIKYAYVGQAKRLHTRLAQHLSGYQHIDLSIKRHRLWSETNPCGWRVNFLEFPVEELDRQERKYIIAYANAGYQLRNKTIGGQGEGKTGLDNQKESKGYYDGLHQGYLNARKFIANLFDKHLTYRQKSDKPNKNQAKAVEKFEDFLNYPKE